MPDEVVTLYPDDVVSYRQQRDGSWIVQAVGSHGTRKTVLAKDSVHVPPIGRLTNDADGLTGTRVNVTDTPHDPTVDLAKKLQLMQGTMCPSLEDWIQIATHVQFLIREARREVLVQCRTFIMLGTPKRTMKMIDEEYAALDREERKLTDAS